MNGTKLVLASSSPTRQKLFQALKVPFASISPDIDESPQEGEGVPELVTRLSQEKARAIDIKEKALIVAADQVATLDKKHAMGKPVSREDAIAQLTSMSGREVFFIGGVSVLCNQTEQLLTEISTCTLRFRTLSEKSIANYVDKESPYECAGSFRSEGLGIALIESLTSDDPTSILGMPLTTVNRMLLAQGFDLLC